MNHMVIHSLLFGEPVFLWLYNNYALYNNARKKKHSENLEFAAILTAVVVVLFFLLLTCLLLVVVALVVLLFIACFYIYIEEHQIYMKSGILTLDVNTITITYLAKCFSSKLEAIKFYTFNFRLENSDSWPSKNINGAILFFF